MRKLLLTVAVVAAAGLVVVATGAALDVPPSYQGITPVVFAGNPDCKDLTGWVDPSRTYSRQLKFVLPVNGASGGGINVTIAPNSAGDGIGWYVLNNESVHAVIVKGGSSANVYFYPAHAEGDFTDGSMTTPGTLQKGKWKFPTLSYMEFCYFPGA